MSTNTKDALARLYAASDAAGKGFPELIWTRTKGGGPETIKSKGDGVFEGITLEQNVTLELTTSLNLPESVHQCAFDGQPLIATINSLYPVDIYWNDELRFTAEGVPVAAGPALFTIIPQLRSGNNGTLRFVVRVPDNQSMNWCGMFLSTPALRDRAETIDIAWAQLAMADAFAVTDDERSAVDRAAALVPEKPEEVTTAALLNVFVNMTEALSPVANRIKNGPRVHLIGHCHIDMNWLWSQQDTDNVIIRDFKSVLSLLDDYPELTFSFSQPAAYEVFRREEPALFEKVLAHIKSGRWEPTTMQWVEGDVNMASGEGQARQLLQGVQYTREVLGYEPTVFHAPDTFGHAGNLPQLAASAGANVYYHHRANDGQENQWPAYWWVGQDGSRLLGISTYSYNGEISAREIANTAIRAHRFGHSAGMWFHGIGDHGGGPARQNLETLRRIKLMPLFPDFFCSSEAGYANEIVTSGVALPTHYGESSTIFEGCYTTHSDTKYYNRAAENLLTTADTLSALAGQNHNATLDGAWQKVLYNQFHDILDGSAIHVSYEQNKSDFEEAMAAGSAAIESALSVLVVGGGDSVTVVNPLGFDREDWVQVSGLTGDGAAYASSADGHVAVGQFTGDGFGFVARVPAFGATMYQVKKDSPSGVEADTLDAVLAFAPTAMPIGGVLANDAAEGPYLLIETPLVKAYVRRDCGIIVSLYDKAAARQLVGFGMRRASDYIDSARPDLALNVFQLVEEHPHGMSSWQYHEVWSEQSLLKGATAEVIEKGPARLVLKVNHKLRSSKIEQKITFYRDLTRIDFETDIDWQEIGNAEKGVPNLKAAFTAHIPEAEAWFETPFAAVQRPADGQEVPALRWADVGGDTYGIAVLNDSKYGYDTLGNRVRLTLVRSGYEPDTVSDLGQHHIRYSLLPHSGNWRDASVVQAGLGYNQPLIARAGAAGKPAFRPTITGATSVVLASLKPAASGAGVVVRLYESEGKAGTVRVGGLLSHAKVAEVSLIEDVIRPIPVEGDSISLSFLPWQVRSVLV